MTVHTKYVYFPAIFLGVLSGIVFFLSGDVRILGYMLIFWSLISGLGVAVGFHRILAHRSLRVDRWLRRTLSLLGSLSMQGSPLSWVAIHRYHHAHTDKEEDPHSPRQGFAWAYDLWMNSSRNYNLIYAGHEMYADKFQMWLHRNYLIYVYLMPLLILCVFGLDVFCGYGLAVLVGATQENLINSFCHIRVFGYRNYEIDNDSVNIPLLGYLCWGQGWHNNHHAHPNWFLAGDKWWEFDPCVIFLPFIWAFSDD